MDPANNNPTPTDPSAPVAPKAPVMPEAPVAPAAPAMPEAPVVPEVPMNPDVANAAVNPPVNPVVESNAQVAPAPSAAQATMSMNQMFQPQPAANPNVFDETTAIAVPEGPKAPDPVEEELKAPLKAAGPVPGSIGSSVSMPPEGGAPTGLPVDPQMMANAPAIAAKKPSVLDKLMTKTKMSKNALILMAVVAGLIVILLIVVLVMVATGSL